MNLENKYLNFVLKNGVKSRTILFSAGLQLASALAEGLSIFLLGPLLKGILLPSYNYGIPESIMPRKLAFIFLLGAILCLILLKNILYCAGDILVARMARTFSMNSRNAIFSRYLMFGKLFFDQNQRGRLDAILQEFTENVAIAFKYFRFIMSNVFLVAIFVILMFVISWRLAVIAVVLSPLIYVSVKGIVNRIKKTSDKYVESKIRQSHKITDILSCIALVKVNKDEDRERARFEELSRNVSRLETKIDTTIAFIYPIQEIIFSVILIGIFGSTIYFIPEFHPAEAAKYLVFIYLLRRCAPYLADINRYKAEMLRAWGPFNQMLDIFENKESYMIRDGKTEFGGLENKIEFRGLSFSYIKGIDVIRNFSSSIDKGKMTAIVGPTGSGKTTLVSLILRLYECPGGSIFLDGVDIRDLKIKSLCDKIAYVSQDTFLFNDTIKNNIIYAQNRDIDEEEIIKAAKSARLYDFIMSLPDKFDSVVGDRGVKLSGGEKQRLSIARAIVKNTGIFILDEATSALDSTTERLIQEAIDYAVKDKTAIVIAHRLSTIKHADKIIVIENGSLAEEGTLKGLLEKKGKFFQYWEEQKFY